MGKQSKSAKQRELAMFSKILERKIEERGSSAQELADLCGVKLATAQKWLNGTQAPGRKHWQKIQAFMYGNHVGRI